MADFALTIQAKVPARNIHSASKKIKDLEAYLAKHGYELPEVRIKGSK